MNTSWIFCETSAGRIPSYPVWQDTEHLAFLTPFPNTPCFTVVIPKAHHESYGLAFAEETLLKFLTAAKKVAHQIDRDLDTLRTGLIMEGYDGNHLHMKLFSIYGIEGEDWKPIKSDTRTFYERYPRMTASNDGPRTSASAR